MHQAGGPVKFGRLPIRFDDQRAGGNATGADAGAGICLQGVACVADEVLVVLEVGRVI